MHVALIHYLYPPTVGGVERVMAEHAAMFARRGHRVTVLCGGGESCEQGVEVRVLPELRPGSSKCAREMRAVLEKALDGVDRVFVHNMMTMPFHPGATEALGELAALGIGKARFVHWIHDLAAINPDYTLDPREVALLSRAWPGFSQVAVSAQRQREFCALTGLQAEHCPVIPNGIDPAKVLGLTSRVAEWERRHRILGREMVLLQPARILRRKNIELGLQVTAALRASGRDAFYIVTGAPDPHHRMSAAYGHELHALSEALGLSGNAVFAAEELPVEESDLGGLYALADAVFLPSRQEGFGLPVLEAALWRLPVFCADREPMRSILPDSTEIFDLEASPEAIAGQVTRRLLGDSARAARKDTLSRYRWDAVFENHMAPLFLAGGT